MSFIRIITGLVWGLQPVILGLAVYHQIELRNTFIFGSSLLYMAGLLLLPLLIRQNQRLCSLIQVLFIGAMVLNGFGAYGWYWTTAHYDDLVHFLSPATFMLGLAILYKPKRLWLLFGITVLASIIWEPLEYYGDQIFFTRTYGQPGQPLDTVYDLMMDFLGVAAGFIVYRLTRQRVDDYISLGYTVFHD